MIMNVYLFYFLTILLFKIMFIQITDNTNTNRLV